MPNPPLQARRSASRALSCIALGAILTGVLACGNLPPPPDGDLYTLTDLVPSARSGTSPLASHIVTPAGSTIALLSDPYTPGANVLEANDSDGLNIQPAFSEGAPAAYVITEVWEQWPGVVWALPLYYPITAVDPVTGAVTFLEDPPTPIYSSNTSMRFYGSYWQINYFLVPAGTNADDYVTTKSIFDAHFPIVKGALSFQAIAPAGVNLAHAAGTMHAVHPFTGAPIDLRYGSNAWAEGEQVNFLDFGRARFVLLPPNPDPTIVESDALYQFAIRNPATGGRVPLDLPRVGGTGPKNQHRSPTFIQGRPQFGTLWHEYTVLLNPATPIDASEAPPGFFVPNNLPGLRALVAHQALGQTVWAIPPDPSIDATDAATLAAYTLRAALNPTECFGTPNPTFPKTPAQGGVCIWLDSQVAIESNLAATAIADTRVLSSCPLVLFNGVQVPQ